MFNPFRRNRSQSQLRPPRAPGETIRKEDALALQEWARGRVYIEAFVEPETVVNEMSVVVVDAHGDFIRRRIGGPKGIDAVAKLLQCDVYDVEETGYPQRMRERIERERILRKREEQRQRRERFEREHGSAKGNPNDHSD
ncbi:oxidoreductase [Corynebacterium striatum]|uniref:Oxidoreductase n=1 Tax=Corynebacterium striatum TaxID=43770 RepID=A0A2Z2IWZ7_CORST|nr:oxidoreductase [Corynebacterium striatum]ART20906.1 oxidoreductase [Corynebacterium striatum]HBC7267405.1 oxidoreductase [Corynebacterium striatum]HCG2963443.1 oxidoreductase [Corynebacterium striatum]